MEISLRCFRPHLVILFVVFSRRTTFYSFSGKPRQVINWWGEKMCASHYATTAASAVVTDGDKNICHWMHNHVDSQTRKHEKHGSMMISCFLWPKRQYFQSVIRDHNSLCKLYTTIYCHSQKIPLLGFFAAPWSLWIILILLLWWTFSSKTSQHPYLYVSK